MACLSPVNSDCIVFTAGLKARLAAIGYTSTNLEDIIVELIAKGGKGVADQLKAIKDTVDNISTDTLKSGGKTFGLSTGTVDSVKLTNRTLDYSLSAGSLTYDLSQVKDSLPTGYSFLGGNATLINSDGKRSSVKGTLNSLKAEAPFTLVVNANINAPNGLLSLEKTILVTKDGSSTATLETRDLTAAPADLTVKEHLDLLSAEIVSLKQR